MHTRTCPKGHEVEGWKACEKCREGVHRTIDERNERRRGKFERLKRSAERATPAVEHFTEPMYPFSKNRPISAEETALEVPMRTKAMPSPKSLPVSPEAVQQAGEEFVAFRYELERITAKVEKLKAFLKTELAKLAIPELIVGDETLYLCPTESKSFDLESAKETLASKELAKLEPFIKHTESFQIKAAEDVGFDLTKFKKFITVRETFQLRTRDKKEAV